MPEVSAAQGHAQAWAPLRPVEAVQCVVFVGWILEPLWMLPPCISGALARAPLLL